MKDQESRCMVDLTEQYEEYASVTPSINISSFRKVARGWVQDKIHQLKRANKDMIK